MSFKDIKIKLHNDIPLLISILEEIGVHQIKKSRRYIQGALPDGDNPTSLCVKLLSENLSTQIFTRSDFNGNDIIDAIIYLSNKSTGDISNWLHKRVGVNHSKTQLASQNFLDIFTRYDRYNGNNFENKILPESSKDMFIQCGHTLFEEDGIDIDTQNTFEIMYDQLDSRIIIPIRDENNNIVTFIGRTILRDIPKMMPKYIAYYPYSSGDILYGLNIAYNEIKNKNEVIVVEAQKSVMKAYQMGYKHTIALSKKKISDKQFEMLLSLPCENITFALDKDVKIEELKSIYQKFKGLKNVYFAIDNNDYLGEKDSPFDCDDMVWDDIYENKIKGSDLWDLKK